MKRPFACTLFVLLIAFMSSTGNAQTVNYEVLENDPSLVPRLQVYLTPISFEAGQMGRHSVSWHVGGRWDVNNRLSVFFNQRRAFKGMGDMTYRSVIGDGNYPVHNAEYDEFKRWTYTELKGRINLISKVKTKQVRIGLSHSKSGGYTRSTYIDVPSQVKRYFGFTGGIVRYASSIEIAEDDNVITSDGSVLHTYGANDAEGNEIVDNNKALHWGINQRVFCLVGGLSWSTATHTKLKVEGYGEKRSAGTTDIFLELLYAPSPVIEDIHHGDMTFVVAGKEEGLMKTSNIGFQCGFHTQTSTRGVNWGYSFTGGFRPGLEGSGGFIQLGIKLPVIGFRVPALPGGMDA